MNCSVIEMGQVSSLLHEGTTVTNSFGEQETHAWVHYAKIKQGNCSYISDGESDDIHRERLIEKLQENLCFRCTITNIKGKKKNHTSSALHQIIIGCTPNSFSSVQKMHVWKLREEDTWVKASQCACSPARAPTHTPGQLSVTNKGDALWPLVLWTSHAPQHYSFSRQVDCYYQKETI